MGTHSTCQATCPACPRPASGALRLASTPESFGQLPQGGVGTVWQGWPADSGAWAGSGGPSLCWLPSWPSPWARPRPLGRLARGCPEGWAPSLARGSIRATCPSPCAFLPGACAGGLAARGGPSWPCSGPVLAKRAPPPHRPSRVAHVAVRLSCSPPRAWVPGWRWATARGPQERGGAQCPEPLG